MRNLQEARNLRQLYDANGAPAACGFLRENLENGSIRWGELSIRNLFEGLVEDGPEMLRLLDHRRKGGGMSLLEAANAVDTSAFSNITGQIMFSKVMEGYNNPAFLWQDLCTTVQTTILDSERIPGIGGTGDLAETVGEGMPYPTVGLNEEYIDTPATEKRGFILPITREIIVADKTGILLKVAGQCGYHYMGINKEKRVLDVVLGVVNNYKRNGTSTNTYLTAGAYINDKTSNALVDWTDVEGLELLFDAITDPNTGEPMVDALQGEMTLIAPTALKRTALRIVNATEVQLVDNQANAGTFRTTGANPLNGTTIKVLSSAYIKARTSSATKWFYGQPKKAVGYREAWGVETMQAASNSEAEFQADIMLRYKVTERGVAYMENPRYLARSDQ